jgi:hypothetical protein
MKNNYKFRLFVNISMMFSLSNIASAFDVAAQKEAASFDYSISKVVLPSPYCQLKKLVFQNPGAETGVLNGWVFSPYTWGIESNFKHTGNYSFRSVDYGSKMQDVPLTQFGVTPLDLDHKPVITWFEYLRAYQQSAYENFYMMTAQLLSAEMQVLSTTYVEVQGSQIPEQWIPVKLQVTAPIGSRFMRIYSQVLGSFDMFTDSNSAMICIKKTRQLAYTTSIDR